MAQPFISSTMKSSDQPHSSSCDQNPTCSNFTSKKQQSGSHPISWDVPAWGTMGWQPATGTFRDTQESRARVGAAPATRRDEAAPLSSQQQHSAVSARNTHSHGLLFDFKLVEGVMPCWREQSSFPSWFYGGERGQKRPKLMIIYSHTLISQPHLSLTTHHGGYGMMQVQLPSRIIREGQGHNRNNPTTRSQARKS